ncbi:MAG: amino acid permease [Ignavibacteria bacterium]|nr:amino acid permease [Ignavibacteria bacterium]MBT8382990.1 amino acid permease [Ignavibacteria bacterium]MBT8391421.1 amino acid permease [Ignavibacteria bacterium]NNJ54372.1 amino acid permease [Ignavibacteriaceae bacterium]NNL22004.1 amino acid permease [Ignavibacteriaceae bacterium]
MKIISKIKPPKDSSEALKGRFGTFAGVFTPDVLTILGVIMYLRLGWVVGNAGPIGAIAIILLAKSITICTGLSMSSITTNIKIGAGGAYSIISKSLGLEAGGSIGIPFYISQTLAASLYIVGFTEGWLLLFPSHDPAIIMVAVWIVILTLSYFSTNVALKFQYIILLLIALSIISFFLTPNEQVDSYNLIGKFEDAGFWQVFAIFFPAVTGIMAGANLSGELKNSRKAIPLGTLSAIGVTLIVYGGLVFGFTLFISDDVLRNDQMAMVNNSRIALLVILGILAATFSSAIGSIVGAPRILQALASEKIIPLNNFFAKRNSKGEPQNAIAFTGVIVLAALFLGSLDSLATLITLFFLITYGTLNLVVFIQQSMKVISFRPTFKIPKVVSFLGAAGCMIIMFLINPVFSVIAFVVIVVLYSYLTKKGLQSQSGDLRGGMFIVLAELASRIASKFPRHNVTWKPDLLIPIEEPKLWSGSLLFIRNIVNPSGSVFAFSVKNNNNEETKRSLNELLTPIKEGKLLVNSAVIQDDDFLHGARLVIQTLEGIPFRPNTLFLTLGSSDEKNKIISEMVNNATNHNLGVIILRQHPRIAFGMQKTINIWLRDKSPNWHLAVLVTLQLQLNWEGKINLITVAEKKEDRYKMYKFLDELSKQTRLPSLTEFHVLTGGFKEAIASAPKGDMSLFGLADDLHFSFMREVTELTNSSCLFVRDSGSESAVA